jgi:hypothetical protein
MKESASQRDFTTYQQSRAPKTAPSDFKGGSPSTPTRSSDYAGPVPPVIPSTPSTTPAGSSGGYSRSTYPRASTVWYPDPQTYATRTVRLRNYYAPYWNRPVVVYHDNYGSFFWWWLLDQSLDDRALWVYHHRHDMDEGRYRELVYQDLALESRVAELEQRQIPQDPSYVPPGMDRDLMYSDQYVDRTYHARPTPGGRVAFWFLMAPVVAGAGGFFIWLVFFKRWQTVTA